MSEHCLVEAVLADVLSELLALAPVRRDIVVRAAIVHDWFKKHEKRILREARDRGQSPLEAYEQSRTEDAHQLRALGVDEEIIRIADAVVPHDRRGPQTIEEKIMWYVDGITSNTEPVRFRERFDNLERGWDGEREDPARAASNRDFSDMFRQRYGGVPLYQVQRGLADLIEPELASLAHFNGNAVDFPLYLRQKIDERISHYGARRPSWFTRRFLGRK
ncbi:MAG TPA: hypothetical protein VNM40_00040 [Candidatus Paceibacterota bacterium]|nr:hypothetical protein [Candidatus Paceibacterota bacterium]